METLQINSNYKNSIYFPDLSDSEIIIFNAVKEKLKGGYAMVSNGLLVDTIPDYKIADMIYLECEYELITHDEYRRGK
ncbi:MAG: hypothetical protein KAR40_16035 [Candidatus Sabulitectum sp.]|nr:hypothetical protein [Candidatus Sabulitectum sp.]